MRVLALAALDVPYIRDNWMDAMAHVLADRLITVNVTPLLVSGPPDAHLKYVMALTASQPFDYVFLYHDYIFSDFADDFFGHLRGAGIRTLTFHPDDDGEVWYQRNRVFDGRFDVVATHSKRSAERRCREKRPTRPFYLPWGFNPRFFGAPAGAPKKQYDVVFVGKYKVHEHDASLYREDGRLRDDTLTRVADYCTRTGRVFRVFGHGWERHPTLARFAGGLLEHDEMVATYHASRIVLNPGWSADPSQPTAQTKLRHFEVAGCGAFQLTNLNIELAELFEPDQEIAFFQDGDDLVDQVARYLVDEPARTRLAENGCRRAHAEHTLDRRVTTLFEHMRQLFPPRRAAVRQAAPRIARVELQGREGLLQLHEEVRAGRRNFDEYDGVHVRCVDGRALRTSYDGLGGFWHASTDVFGVRTFYDAESTFRNALQPSRHEVRGGLLSHGARLSDIPAALRSRVLECFVGVDDGDRLYPLVNYIARPRALAGLLEAFVGGDAARVAELDVLATGLIVNEFRIEGIVDEGAMATPSEPVFAAPLRQLLRRAAALGQSVAIYGARGDMAERAFSLVREAEAVRLVGLVDRAMAGTTIGGVPIVGFFDLPAIAPDIVVIAAAYSGPAIMEQLKPIEPRTMLVPLYDLHAPIWSLLLP